MSFYKYVNTNALEHIINGSIRFTQPGGFNDPFELALEIFNPDAGNGEKIKINLDLFPVNTDIKKYLINEKISDPCCNDIFFRQLIKQLNSMIGILCLTKNPKSHLMWAHYADDYSGALIQLDENHDFFAGAFEVQYSPTRPIVHINYFKENESIAIPNLCIKSDIWSYENEWRVIRSLENCDLIKAKHKNFDIYTMNIPLEAIQSVTFGERCPIEVQRNIFNKLKQTHIALDIAVLSNREYEFENEILKHNVPLGDSPPIISPITAPIFENEEGVIGDRAKNILAHDIRRDIIKLRL
ncbi:hypothetical protein KSGM81_00653 [Klebsiella quasipneumoniae]|uniref:DUF2971 domain-containing protein n=1 Tax=Klebsiella TaxID=570 RepID=UPI00111B3BC3|nr:DUF2971 domain-containing protein [Klebsiella quasipneumoniae]SNQ37753.1 hypothetical protein KSGM81_00653 [Klebsiella quasipneumoniae]